MEKKTNKAKLEILNFWENRLNRKAIAFDKISRNCAFYGNSIKLIHLLGYFCIIENHWNCLRFSLNSWADYHKKKKIYYFLDGKEDK